MMKKYNFTIEWKSGSFNDNIVKFLESNDIEYSYDHFGQLVADIGTGKLYKFDYEKISGDKYGVIVIPID